MSYTALWELQKALFSALANDTDLSAKTTGVYDQVSESAVFPYVTLGEPTSTPNDTKTTYGENITWVLHCWSDYGGKKEAYEILNLMLKAISSLSIGGGFSVEEFKREQLQVITDIDGVTKHGILRVRFIIGGN